MKPIKTLGLAALMALLAMAFVVPGSATAEGLTGLCMSEGEEGRCTVPHIHETSVGKGVFLSSVLNVECEVLFSGDVTAKGLEELKPLVIEGKFTFSGCSSGCTVTEENSPTLVKVLRTGHETAKVTSDSEFHVKCSFSIDCTYSTEGVIGTAKGALLSTQKNGEVSTQGQTLKKVKGFFCPETAKLDMTTTPLEPIYIVNAEDILLGFCAPVFGIGLYKSFTCSQASDDPKHESSWEFFSI